MKFPGISLSADRKNAVLCFWPEKPNQTEYFNLVILRQNRDGDVKWQKENVISILQNEYPHKAGALNASSLFLYELLFCTNELGHMCYICQEKKGKYAAKPLYR